MKATIVSVLLSMLLLTGCNVGYGYKIDPTERCDGVIVAKDSWSGSVTVAYTYGKQYYVTSYQIQDDYLFSDLHDGEKVKVYAWDGIIEGIEK